MRALGVLGGLICIAGGAWLFSIKAAGQNSILEAVANGLGEARG